MFFLCIFPVIGGSMFPKRSAKSISIGYVSPPNIGALTPPMHDQYNFSYVITRNCNISNHCQPLLETIPTKTLFIMLFVYSQIQLPVSAYDFFIMLICKIHVNFWFILNRLAKVASKLVQKLGRDKRLRSVCNLPF